MPYRHTFIVIILVLAALLVGAGERLYVVNALSDDITVIDLATDTVVGRIPLHARGYHLALAGNDLAYVTTTPETGGQANIAAPSALVIVNLRQAHVAGQIPLDLAPLAPVHLLPGGERAVIVTASPHAGSRNVEHGQALVVDLVKRKVQHTIPVGLNPLDCALSPDGKTLYTADWASKALSVVDLTTNGVRATIPTAPLAPRALVLRADGKALFVGLEHVPTVPNLAANAYANNAMAQGSQMNAGPQQADELPLLWEITLPSGAIRKIPVEGLSAIRALALSPDGQRLYVYGRVTPPAMPLPPANAVQQNMSQTSNMNMPQAARNGTPLMPSAGYGLVVVDIKHNRTERWGDFGYISCLALNTKGTRLYLIGTAGDPRLEAEVNNHSAQYQSTKSPGLQEVERELSRVQKTVTVLDAGTGKVQKKLPVGSFPQDGVVGK